jgi:predicted Zn-dependent protease
VHRLPQVSADNLGLAQAEVQAAGRPSHFDASDKDVVRALRILTARIAGVGGQVCREMNVGVCAWTFRLSPDKSMNTSARSNGIIVMNRGVIEYATCPEEVCFVIAHEMGHQAADHVAARRHNRMVGALVGAVLPLGLGAQIGALSYSKEQEREADYLAALILYRAGVDLDKARGMDVSPARPAPYRADR